MTCIYRVQAKVVFRGKLHLLSLGIGPRRSRCCGAKAPHPNGTSNCLY
ncbi:hypothetical protein I552_0544 [Mycobacterium xenopi 3993]|nr:hypothetical protein I552_0544 [Mycobacterium xenopi 3993]